MILFTILRLKTQRKFQLGEFFIIGFPAQLKFSGPKIVKINKGKISQFYDSQIQTFWDFEFCFFLGFGSISSWNFAYAYLGYDLHIFTSIIISEYRIYPNCS